MSDVQASLVTFAQMGFGSTVVPSSAAPQTDGYIGSLAGMPFHIHPSATPGAWAALQAAISEQLVTVNPYIAPPPPDATQLAAAAVARALAAGLTITSTGTPAVSGTYPIGPDQQTRIAAIEIAILKNNVFPGSNGTSLAQYDMSGVPHVFPSVALFSEYATAIANYVADLDLYAAGAPSAAMPDPKVTIA